MTAAYNRIPRASVMPSQPLPIRSSLATDGRVAGSRAVQGASAFTLIELLVVMSIIAALMGIILPSLSAGRETAHMGKCLANLKEIATASMLYMDDEGTATQPWHLGWDTGYGIVNLISEHVYGGFQTEVPHPEWGWNTDMHVVPTQARPYNKYLSPGVHRGPLKIYMCPSDKNNTTPNVLDRCRPPIGDDRFSAWEVNGTSYAINWYWLESPPWYGEDDYYGDIGIMSLAGNQMLRMKVGGAASEFVLFMENSMNSYMLDARPPDGSLGQSCLEELGTGWHRQFSKYAMAMMDGHAEHRYIDTRYTAAAGWDLWAEPGTPKGF